MTEAWTQFMRIRTATHLDRDAIRRIHLAAFAEEERDIVSALAINLLQEDSTPPTLSLVAENDGRIVGHIAFSPVRIGNNSDLQGYILAPLAVEPEFQHQGVGSKLIGDGKQRSSFLSFFLSFHSFLSLFPFLHVSTVNSLSIEASFGFKFSRKIDDIRSSHGLI